MVYGKQRERTTKIREREQKTIKFYFTRLSFLCIAKQDSARNALQVFVFLLRNKQQEKFCARHEACAVDGIFAKKK